MTGINISEKVKQDLEEIKEKGEFKSLDAVIRHFLDARVIIRGGIFLGSNGRNPIDVHNVPLVIITNNLSALYIEDVKSLDFWMCLGCGAMFTPPQEVEVGTIHLNGESKIVGNVVVPQCPDCKSSMARITIKVEP